MHGIRALRQRFRALGAMAVAHLLFTAMGLVSGPLLARALAPTGRGHLAAVLVPFGLCPAIFAGFQLLAARSAAREASRGTERASPRMCAAAAAAGSVSFALILLLHKPLSGGSDRAAELLVIGFALMPLVLVLLVLQGTAWGSEDWHRLAIARVLPAALTLGALVLLSLADALTLTSAAIASFCGAVSVGVPLWRYAPRLGRPVASGIAHPIRFTAKASLASSAQVANARLDQVLMVPVVGARELGLYAVAVSASSLSVVLVAAVVSVGTPRVSRGDLAFAAFAVRTALAAVVFVNLILAFTLPTLIPWIFGDSFRDAVPMALVLLAASVPGAGAWVLGTFLSASGSPGVPAAGEVVAVTITVLGLVALLAPYGGIGAGITSLLAYSGNLAFQTRRASRLWSCAPRTLLIPYATDVTRAVGRPSR